jgi:hypothetical protein
MRASIPAKFIQSSTRTSRVAMRINNIYSGFQVQITSYNDSPLHFRMQTVT